MERTHHTHTARTRKRRRKCGASNSALTAIATCGGVLLLASCSVVQAQLSSTAAVARWGQSSALVSSLFVIYGGKTQGTVGGGYTYTSGPNSADLLALDLTQTFSAGASSTAPWQIIMPANTSSSSSSDTSTTPPAVSFGALSPLSANRLVLFGGDGSPQVPIQTRNDSMYFIQLSSQNSNSSAEYVASWMKAATSWSEPMRRVYATSESASDGRYWLVGGEKADGSGTLLDEAWAVDVSSGKHAFSSMSPPPGSIAGQTSTLLSDGTLLMLGGQDSSGQMHSLEHVVAYDTNKKSWRNITTTTAAESGPKPRRGHVAVSLPAQRVFIHGGSPDSAMSTALDDAWILDWSQDPPRWASVDTSSGGPSARFGHSAVAYGRKVVMTLGWTGSNPADTGTYVLDTSALKISSDGSATGATWSQSYSPDPDVEAGSSISSGGSGSSGSSSTNNPGGNGSSTSSGGDESDSNTNGSSTSSSSPHFGSDSPTSGSGGGNTGDGDKKDGGAGGAAKAGAVIGAFVAVGLAVAAGYAVYHRYEQKRLNNWRHGDGSHALLGVADMEAGGGYGNEKSLALYAAGTRPAGPRSYARAAGPGATESRMEGPEPGKARVGALSAEQPYDMEMANVAASQREPAVVPVWSPTAAGHAIEGPGPRMRDRLAMLTGFAAWAPQSQPRFDMLADEDDDEADRRAAYASRDGPRMRLPLRGNFEQRSETYDEDVADDVHHLREHSYGRLGQIDVEDNLDHYDDGSIDSDQRDSVDDLYTTSPFEDNRDLTTRPSGPRAFGSRSSTGLLAAASVAFGLSSNARDRLESDDGHSSSSGHVDSLMANSAPSDQTHGSGANGSFRSGAEDSSLTPSSRSAGQSNDHTASSRSSHLMSFSDTPFRHNRRGSHPRLDASMTPLDGPRISDGMGSMRRSSTWWGRIMGNLERTSSGRFAGSPGARAPIRDPAPPPALNLSTIKESPRSAQPSEDNPFADVVQVRDIDGAQSSLARSATVGVGGRGVYDEMGRKRPHSQQWEEIRDGEDGGVMASSQHGRSQSSLQSARTNTSSFLEAQFRGMDVVQRTRTGSSRHTTSTRRTGSHNTSEPGSLSSRMGSLYESGLPEHTEEGPEEEETPGQVIWQPQDWQGVRSPPSSGMRLAPMPEAQSDVDESMDIVEGATQSPMALADADDSREQSFGYSGGEDALSPFDDPSDGEYRAPYETGGREAATLRHLRSRTIPREVSEVPSITPATTKRARQNPALIAPVNPQPRRARETPLTGSVKDRVKEIEKKRSADGALPPPSPELLLSHSPAKKARRGVDQLDFEARRSELKQLNTSAQVLGHGFPNSTSTSSIDTEAERERSMMSPIRITSPVSAKDGKDASQREGQQKVQHGLVPKAQIMIANPDDVD